MAKKLIKQQYYTMRAATAYMTKLLTLTGIDGE
jgi:hypothetical protein